LRSARLSDEGRTAPVTNQWLRHRDARQRDCHSASVMNGSLRQAQMPSSVRISVRRVAARCCAASPVDLHLAIYTSHKLVPDKLQMPPATLSSRYWQPLAIVVSPRRRR
jgi:hypothetical protein